MGHVTSTNPWGDIDIDTSAGSVFSTKMEI